jgi:hypothetical protein
VKRQSRLPRASYPTIIPYPSIPASDLTSPGEANSRIAVPLFDGPFLNTNRDRLHRLTPLKTILNCRPHGSLNPPLNLLPKPELSPQLSRLPSLQLSTAHIATVKDNLLSPAVPIQRLSARSYRSSTPHPPDLRGNHGRAHPHAACTNLRPIEIINTP